jgi:hypothetical protein
MKKKWIFLLVAMLLCTISQNSFAACVDYELMQEKTIKLKVDLSSIFNCDMTQGPTDFCIDEIKHKIYLLDAINSRIIRFDYNGNAEGELYLDKDLYFSSFYIDEEYIYLLKEVEDCITSPTIYKFSLDGEFLSSRKLPLNDLRKKDIRNDDTVLTLYVPAVDINKVTDEYIELEYADGTLFKYSFVNEEYQIVTRIMCSQEISKNEYDRKDMDIDYTKIQDYTVGYYYLETPDELFANRIVNVKTGKNEIRSYKLYNSKAIYPINDFVVLHDTVYQMIFSDRMHIQIAQEINEGEKLDIVRQKDTKALSDVVHDVDTKSGLTRSGVYNTALTFTSCRWYYDESINGDHVVGAILPDYLPANSAYVVGVPYCWGGYDYSKTVSDFTDSISPSEHFMAGNVNIGGNYISHTAGVDCSGFVSAVYNIGYKLSTTTIPNKFYSLGSNSDALLMDVFNKSGHAFMFVSFDGSSSNYSGVYTIESTIAGNDCCHTYYRSKSVSDQYTARRFNSW